MCAIRRPGLSMLDASVKKTRGAAGDERGLTVTSVMKGTGMLAEGGAAWWCGSPLKWNSRRLALVLPTSLRPRHAAFWQFIAEGIGMRQAQAAKRCRSCRKFEDLGRAGGYRLSKVE